MCGENLMRMSLPQSVIDEIDRRDAERRKASLWKLTVDLETGKAFAFGKPVV